MVAAALVAVGVGGLSNAALSANVPPKAPVAYNWTGFYAGVQAGYGWGAGSVNLSPIDTIFYSPTIADGEIPASSSLSSKGFLGGVEAGYNYQYGRAVLGVEADFSYSAIRGSNTNVSNPPFAQPIIITDEDKKLAWFGTLRGRLGFLPAPSMLAYVTGGLAYGKTSSSTTTTAITPGIGGANECPAPFFNGFCSAGSTSSVRAGWTLGAGFESLIARNWSVKAEYLYYDLGRASYTDIAPNYTPPAVMQTNVRFNGSIARVGLNYLFN
jgi:outer membrane immunogenic protein